jgi:hypothetical protein
MIFKKKIHKEKNTTGKKMLLTLVTTIAFPFDRQMQAYLLDWDQGC